MKKQIMKMEYNNLVWSVVHVDGKVNPYIVYRKWYDNGWHTKKVDAYADFNSCVCCIANETCGRELRLA